ncbi:hypothetical protein OVA14_07095 [Agrococcus sp. SL85]|uniref:hypothetical protein n=1 Tax=Agrococcus sp. SL85 TaxID=2995141 RepID=UPI00226C97DD|nr:hypothetical protein [Agrococcus sp. SL85]WAC65159.1 hypothetical protein OVA14_07095 [Agrococcus sp. SL85]
MSGTIEPWIGRTLRDRNRGWEKRTIRVIGVAAIQVSSVGVRTKSTIYEVEQITNMHGQPEVKRARIQEHILKAKWRDA